MSTREKLIQARISMLALADELQNISMGVQGGWDQPFASSSRSHPTGSRCSTRGGGRRSCSWTA